VSVVASDAFAVLHPKSGIPQGAIAATDSFNEYYGKRCLKPLQDSTKTVSPITMVVNPITKVKESTAIKSFIDDLSVLLAAKDI